MYYLESNFLIIVLMIKSSHVMPSNIELPRNNTNINVNSQENISAATNSTNSDISEELVHIGSTSTRKETTPDLILAAGYPAEVHHVETEDGYILEVHRIPRGKNVSFVERSHRPVVYLQHCFLCASSDWVINTPDKALGFVLADEGYDVWMGNARGNTYSRRHKNLTTRDKKFWKFSWDEIAYYDLPASIDYILNTTNSTYLNYVGFSMGTTVLFAMLSEKPAYNDKVRLMVALGPVAFLEHMGGPLSLLTRYAGPVKSFADFVGIYEVLRGGILLDLITSILCDPLVTNVAPICDNVLLRMIGLDTDLMNKKLLTKVLAHTPAGTSLQTMIHFMQAKNSGRFQMFSYGPSGNRKIYRNKYPPSYNLNRTRIPVALVWASNDWYANSKDVKKLRRLLPNVIMDKKVPDETFSHVDFIWSDSAVDLIYSDVIELLREYN